MSTQSRIEWTESTWNPITGCIKISPGARPVQKEWITEIRNQCIDAGVPFFFKQWGGVRKKQNGKTLDGRTWTEFPSRLAIT